MDIKIICIVRKADKNYCHSIPDNSSVLVLFLKALKVRTVLLESGNEFQSFGAIKLQDLRP